MSMTGGMQVLDWCILATYLAFTLCVGIYLQRRASADLDSYFVAGRSLPGWLVGTSMVATTFAADTPLAVTGLVAENGIAGNWFWWSLAFGHLCAAFFFAPYWRRAEVITDAEFIELRYSGQSAALLRTVRAFYFAIPINCIIMGWVIRAMGKIVRLLFPWDVWLGPETYGWLESIWPQGMAISTPSEGLSILVGVVFAVSYATLGGLPGVILTDVAQFVLAMFGSIMLAIFAVEQIGGLDALSSSLEQVYGSEANQITAFFPSMDSTWLPIQVFLVYIFVQWWAQKFSDGGGILVQRMSAAKDEANALRGTSWFVIAHYALRPWPWIIVALVSLVLYPLHQQGALPFDDIVRADREMAYPVLMFKLLPTGILGIMVTGMAAAFMSTIDTHITWGSSYLVKDFYQRLWKPDATQKELVRAGRIGILLITVIALAITTQINSISDAWKFITAMGSGIGLVSILRWFWWRINAISELVGMTSAALLSVILYGFFDAQEMPYHITLLIVVGISTVAMFVATFMTPPSSDEQLKKFCAKIKPVGFWAKYRDTNQPSIEPGFWAIFRAWVLASIGLFAILFGIGEVLLGTTWFGWNEIVVGAACWVIALRWVKALPLKNVPPVPQVGE